MKSMCYTFKTIHIPSYFYAAKHRILVCLHHAYVRERYVERSNETQQITIKKQLNQLCYILQILCC